MVIAPTRSWSISKPSFKLLKGAYAQKDETSLKGETGVMNEEHLTNLYNIFYTEAVASGRSDIDASLWSYDEACKTLRELNRQEVKYFIRERMAA